MTEREPQVATAEGILGEVEHPAAVTPWEVTGEIDYMRLIKDFGTELITEELKAQFERVTGKPLHPWMRRGIFFSHRNLKAVLDAKV